jgi:hypothetical protein
MGLFATDTFKATERAFALNVPNLNPDLWVNFVTQIRAFVQQPQQQQPQQQQPQQQYQQQQMQQQYPQQQQQSGEAEPVLGHVSPMPSGITASAARAHEAYIKEMGKRGGKRSRSNKRGRKSVRGHKKSVHKIRRRKSNHNKRH